MRHKVTGWLTVLFLTLTVGAVPTARALLGDGDLCPGTGADCVVSGHVIVADLDGIIDVRPLKLVIKPTGLIVANTNPVMPLTIKAGAITVEKGGAILGTVQAGKGNSLTLITQAVPGVVDGAVTILGTVDASSVRLNGTGGDGGSVGVTAAGACQISGKVRANGTPSTSIGGGGGDISFDCASILVTPSALIDASAAGPMSGGGSVSLGANVGNLLVAKGATLRVRGSGLDGGSVSLSTDSTDVNDACEVDGKIVADARTVAQSGGSGGGLDITCGGDVLIGPGASIGLSGLEGGGEFDLFGGGDLTVAKGVAIKANGSDATGGTIDISAANSVTIAGKMETRAGGLNGNDDGSISITNGRDLVIKKGGIINASAARKDQQAGQIVLVGGGADVGIVPVLTIEKGAVIKANGHTSGLGAVEVDLSGSLCTIGGSIQADGELDTSAAIGLSCDNIFLDSTSLIHSSSSGATAGSFTLDTSGELSGTPGTCTLGGKIFLKGMTKSFSNPQGGAQVVAPGHGGTLSATCGLSLAVTDRANIDVSSGGPQSVGGQVILSANLPAHVQGTMRAAAAGVFSRGGSIALGAPDVYMDASAGSLDVGGETGGTIEVTGTDGAPGAGVVRVEKVLNAKGTFGGNVVVSGCDVTVASGGWMRADGSKIVSSGGNNEVHARNQLTVTGKMTAVNGENLLFYNSSSAPSLGGTIKPTAMTDASLTACP